MIGGADVSDPSKMFVIALHCAVYLLLLIVIAVVVAPMGERAEQHR